MNKLPTITIEAKEKEEGDIFYKGNVVCCDGVLILVSGGGFSDTHFSGIALSHVAKRFEMSYGNDWCKNQFEQFVGRITIDI